jgi:hypothetical protein
MVRAAHPLMAESPSLRGELPGTYPWWVSTVQALLADAHARNELPDLSSLVPPGGTPDSPVAALCGWATASAVPASGLSDGLAP